MASVRRLSAGTLPPYSSARAVLYWEIVRRWAHDSLVKQLLATVNENFATIERLLRELRDRIARAAESVHVVAEKAASSSGRRRKSNKKKPTTRR